MVASFKVISHANFIYNASHVGFKIHLLFRNIINLNTALT